MSRIKLMAILIAAICGLVLVFQNTTPVQAKLLFVSVQLSLTVLLLLAMGIGFVLGLVTALFAFGPSSKPPK